MDLNSLEDIKTIRLTEDYIQPRFKSCTSGEAHLAILDTSGSVWSTGALIQSGKLNKIKQFRILLTYIYLKSDHSIQIRSKYKVQLAPKSNFIPPILD